MEIKKTYYIADDEHADSIYLSQHPVCIDLVEVERLAMEWNMTTSQALDMMHEADADEIAEYGVYDSDKSVIFQTGFIIGQSVKAIQDKLENGASEVPFESAKIYPWVLLRAEKFWIDRYGLNYALLKNMTTRAQVIINAQDHNAKDEYRAGVFIGYMAKQRTF